MLTLTGPLWHIAEAPPASTATLIGKLELVAELVGASIATLTGTAVVTDGPVGASIETLTPFEVRPFISPLKVLPTNITDRCPPA